LSKDGTMPFARYVIREKGKIELGNNACAFCHTRSMPDGNVIKGAQGNFPFDRAVAFGVRRRSSVEKERAIQQVLFGAPWLKPDPADRVRQMSLDEIAAAMEAIPPGVIARHRSSQFYPPVIPDLIYTKDNRYLDRTGLVRHRDIGDLMRYAALNNEMDFLSRFGDFIPGGKGFRELPDPSTQFRYSDEQLYALSLYIYSLSPPPNPNKFDATASRGQTVFDREACARCHTPPSYTNNQLLAVEEIGTDPNLTLRTRRGTGFYKVPSLRGVWRRGPFEHNGSVATLEDWFDPARLRNDYVPTGFKGYGVEKRAVKGHPYGLSLSVEDRRALIAFLKTLD
jgi:cytochrome c553